MRELYIHQRSMHRRRYSKFWHRVAAFGLLAASILAIGAFIFFDSRSGGQPSSTSKPEKSVIADTLTTFKSPYFEFQDTGKWVLDQKNSTPTKFTYIKFHGEDVRAQLIIYIDETPIPLNLASSRVLPVRVVGYNSLDATSISGRCLDQYQAGELHKVKIVNIDGANMLCDPDSSAYTIVLAEINGDYKLNLKRTDGTPLQAVVTFRDVTLDPKPDSLLQIAKTFKTI